MTKQELEGYKQEYIHNNKINPNLTKERKEEIDEIIKSEYFKHFTPAHAKRLCKCRNKVHNMMLKLTNYVK